MNSLIVFYSFTGNTEKVANILADALRKKGQVTVQNLKPINETKHFYIQCFKARFGKKAILESGTNFDISKYELLCLGTPVWAFAPTPAINTYLDKLSGVNAKKVLIFTTYGSGAGVGKCVNNIKKRLADKGVSEIKVLNIQMNDVKNTSFVEKKILESGLG